MSDMIYPFFDLKEVVAFTACMLLLKIGLDISGSIKTWPATQESFGRLHEHLQSLERHQDQEIGFLKDRISSLENRLGAAPGKVTEDDN